MPITIDNFRKFYFGAAAESFIQTECYAFGHEAYKANPDIGYDLCVTNNARAKFLEEDKKIYNIQVKSRLMMNEKVEFIISCEDMKLLLSDDSAVLVCVYQKPNIGVDPNSFHYNRDSFNLDMIDRYIEEMSIKNELLGFRNIKIDELEKKYNIISYNRRYIWFNNMQLKRLNELGLIKEVEIEREIYKSISTIISDESIAICGKDDEELYIVSELYNLKYLFNSDNKTEKSLMLGKIFIEDTL